MRGAGAGRAVAGPLRHLDGVLGPSGCAGRRGQGEQAQDRRGAGRLGRRTRLPLGDQGVAVAADDGVAHLQGQVPGPCLAFHHEHRLVAYADQFPVLLTEPGSLPSDTATALTNLNIQQVIVMGGPMAFSDNVVTSIENMGISVLRIAGQTFGATSAELADFEANTTSNKDGLSWDPKGTITVACGDYYTDGLAGLAVSANAGTDGRYSSSGTASMPELCGSGPTPLLLTNEPTTVGTHLTSFLNEARTKGIDGLGDTLINSTKSVPCPSGTETCCSGKGANDIITSLTVFGGPLAVTPATIYAMETDLNG